MEKKDSKDSKNGASFLQASAKAAAQMVECPTCLVPNPQTAAKCICCASDLSPAPPPPVVIKAPGKKWECQMCLLQNEASALKCIACMSPNPSAPGPADAVVASVAAAGISFGVAAPVVVDDSFGRGFDPDMQVAMREFATVTVSGASDGKEGKAKGSDDAKSKMSESEKERMRAIFGGPPAADQPASSQPAPVSFSADEAPTFKFGVDS